MALCDGRHNGPCLGASVLGESSLLSTYSQILKIITGLALKLAKAMATHSSSLAWKIPWMEEADRLQSMGSRRVRHD